MAAEKAYESRSVRRYPVGGILALGERLHQLKLVDHGQASRFGGFDAAQQQSAELESLLRRRPIAFADDRTQPIHDVEVQVNPNRLIGYGPDVVHRRHSSWSLRID